MKVVEDISESFKRLNVQDRASEEDEEVASLNEKVRSLLIEEENLIERGKEKSQLWQKSKDNRPNPVFTREKHRYRTVSVDSGTYSDASNTSSPCPSETSTTVTPLEEELVWTTNSTTRQVEVLTIDNRLKKILDPEVRRKRWVELAIMAQKDVFSDGVENLNKVLEQIDGDNFNETFYTLMELLKQDPKKCCKILEAKDSITNLLKSANRDTGLLVEYFEVSVVLINMLKDYNPTSQ